MKMLFPVLLAFAATSAAAEPVLIVTNLSNYYTGFVVLPNDNVIYRAADGLLHSMDPTDPSSDTIIETDWNPAEHGWEVCGQEGLFRANSDGSMLLYTSQLRVPDSLQTSETYVPGPAGVFVTRPDGSGTRLVALSMEVGSGPDFQFTQSGDRFYGSPLLNCPATPAGMVEYWLREEETNEFRGYMVDPADGSRSGGPEGFLGDGFLPNPWSDLTACGGWPPDMIADASTGETLLELPCSEDAPWGIIEQWVLPNAGLSHDNKNQLLRYADGRTVCNPGTELIVNGRLADGRYLVSYGYREPLLLAEVDWETFEVTVVESYPVIGALMTPMNEAVELPSGGAIVFRSEDGLYFAEL
jgi:hypothetical protein